MLKASTTYRPRHLASQKLTSVLTASSTQPIYPDSYYTGPLGTNNILPTDVNGALLILWYDGPVSSTQKRTDIQQRMTDCNRTFDGLGIHYGGTDAEIPGRGGSSLGSGSETWVHQQGSIPIVSWVHNRTTRGSTNLNTMQEINNGSHDSFITEAATYWAGLNFRIMWRPFWEFDGDWFPWSPTSNASANDGSPNPGCTATEWKTAWQRVVGLVQNAGANKVGLCFCPTESNNQSLARSCYPGDLFVDWCGSDGYNQADDTSGAGHPVQTSPLHAGWAEYWEIYNYTGHGSSAVCNHDYFGPTKPYITMETSSLYDSGTSTRKANWYKNIDNHANAKSDMPYLKGIQIFDQNLASSEGFDWRVDSNQTYTMKQSNTAGSVDATTYQGFKDLAAIARWNVGVIGGAT